MGACRLHPLGPGQARLGLHPEAQSDVEGIYAYEGPLALPGQDEVVRTNSLVVITDDGVVVVDGQDNVEEAERMLEAIAKVTSKPVRYLINASPHGDHVNGNAAFGDAVIVPQERARDAMRDISPPPLLPSMVYADRLTLYVGGKTIELHYCRREEIQMRTFGCSFLAMGALMVTPDSMR